MKVSHIVGRMTDLWLFFGSVLCFVLFCLNYIVVYATHIMDALNYIGWSKCMQTCTQKTAIYYACFEINQCCVWFVCHTIECHSNSQKIAEQKLQAFAIGAMGQRPLSRREQEERRKKEEEQAAASVCV